MPSVYLHVDFKKEIPGDFSHPYEQTVKLKSLYTLRNWPLRSATSFKKTAKGQSTSITFRTSNLFIPYFTQYIMGTNFILAQVKQLVFLKALQKYYK
jgi:hypothetical protein